MLNHRIRDLLFHLEKSCQNLFFSVLRPENLWNLDFAVQYTILLCNTVAYFVFSWPYMVKWHKSGIIKYFICWKTILFYASYIYMNIYLLICWPLLGLKGCKGELTDLSSAIFPHGWNSKARQFLKDCVINTVAQSCIFVVVFFSIHKSASKSYQFLRCAHSFPSKRVCYTAAYNTVVDTGTCNLVLHVTANCHSRSGYVGNIISR